MARVAYRRDRWRTGGLLAAVTVAAAMLVPVGGLADAASAANGSSGNGLLAFHGADDSGQSDIWVMALDGSGATNLTSSWQTATDIPSSDRNPAWSPDGSKIAVLSNRDAAVGVNHLWIMNADGSNATKVSSSVVSQAGHVTWSPDGQWLAYRTPSDSIARVRVDGTGESTVVDSSKCGFALAPEWSPDGTTIAHQCDGTAGLVNPDGSNHRVFRDPGFYPEWSPDGSKVVYWNAGLRTVNIDGSADALLVPDSASGLAMPSVWSPDGSTVLYAESLTTLGTLVFTVPASGGTPTPVPTPPQLDVSIHWDWQPIPKDIGAPIVGLVDPAQGLWHLFDNAGAEVSSFFFGNPGDYPIVGDWNCDGVETPGMYRQSDGYVYLRNSNTQGAADIRFFFGDPGDVPIAGDFNKDGCDTVSIYRPASQTFFIINALGANDGGLGAAEFSYVFGDPGDKPFVGDFDGDGVETVGLHRESTGLVYFRNSHTQGVADAQFIFGDPGDRLIAGDWNGDGKFSPALFRPGNTTMYFRYTNTQGNADNQFVPAGSQAPWLPVAGVFSK